MKFALCLVAAVFAVVASASSDAGQFVPRAFYTLDSEGHQSLVHNVNDHILRRLRRQVQQSSSSSSSSFSSSSDGGPVYFSSQQTVHNSNGLNGVGNTGAAGIGINSRFGESSSSGVPVGHVVQTSGVLDSTGHLLAHTTHGVIDSSGKVKVNTQYTQH